MTAPYRAATLTKNLKLEKQGLEIGPLGKPIVITQISCKRASIPRITISNTVVSNAVPSVGPRAQLFLTGDAFTSRESKVLL